jgi:transposase
MNDIETQQRFVALRAEGWSFTRIATELKVSKPTLITWSRKFQFDIHNQRAITIETLQEKWLASQEARVALLGEQLQRVQAELSQRDVASLSTTQLFALATALRREIKSETGPVEFTVSTAQIPLEEYYEKVRNWAP